MHINREEEPIKVTMRTAGTACSEERGIDRPLIRHILPMLALIAAGKLTFNSRPAKRVDTKYPNFSKVEIRPSMKYYTSNNELPGPHTHVSIWKFMSFALFYYKILEVWTLNQCDKFDQIM